MQTSKGNYEAYKDGLIGKNSCDTGWDLDIYIIMAHTYGEETALLESLEGKRSTKIKPIFPALIGLYGCPTIINNVETISVVPTILRRGAKWFSSLEEKIQEQKSIVFLEM